jgi:putative flippase GtrA
VFLNDIKMTSFLYRFWQSLPESFRLFLLIGGITTLTQYVILIVCVSVLFLPAWLGSVLGYGVGGTLNYALNRRFAFRSTVPHRTAMLRFLGVMSVGLALTAILMAVGVSFLLLPYLLAQILTTGFVLFVNYTLHRLWTFAEEKPKDLNNGRP